MGRKKEYNSVASFKERVQVITQIRNNAMFYIDRVNLMGHESSVSEQYIKRLCIENAKLLEIVSRKR